MIRELGFKGELKALADRHCDGDWSDIFRVRVMVRSNRLFNQLCILHGCTNALAYLYVT